MPLEERIPVEDLALGLVLMDPLLITLQFWEGDWTMDDGHQEISLEQRMFLCDQSDRVLLCTGRKIAKTLSLERDIVQIGITWEQKGTLDEGMFFTPAQSHLDPVRDRIFAKITAEPLFYEMIARTPKGAPILSKGDGVIQFKTSWKWHLRIEGVSGKDTNMVGLRTRYIIGDEMAFSNDLCHRSRVNTAMPGCKWKYCGVPNGVRGTPFWRLDQTPEGRSWSRHKYPQYINPLFATDSERRRLIEDHGGQFTHSYITQVLGQWGDEVMSSFPPGTIATYADRPYFCYEWGEKMGAHAAERGHTLDYLAEHLPIDKRVVIGWDFGVSPDPAVISLLFEEEPGIWYLRAMFVLRQVTSPHQINLVNQIMDRFHVAFLCTDEAVIIQQLEHDTRWAVYSEETQTGNIQWANLTGKIDLLDALGQVVLDETGDPIREQRKKWSTDELRNAMVHFNENLIYPYKVVLPDETLDHVLIDELRGTVERKMATGSQYLTAKRTEGSQSPDDHRTDSLRYAVLSLYALLGARATNRRVPFSQYKQYLGWKGGREWKPPWSS